MLQSAAMNAKSLSGKTALITGASKGLGKAMALALAEAGANLALVSRDLDKLLETAAAVRAHGVEAEAIRADVTAEAQVAALEKKVAARFGRIQILINNAGIASSAPVGKISLEEWNRIFAVNVTATFLCTQAALPAMIERGSGRIVNVSSVIGEMGNIGQANYAASKSGLFGLTKTLAREANFQLARAGKLTEDSIGITVNTVTPGFVATEMLEHIPDKVLDKIKAQIPVGRLAQPEEIARVVHFLAADAASYITGQVWGVNGGLDM